MTLKRDPLSLRSDQNAAPPVEAAESLRRERDLISAVLDTAGALVVVMDREGHIVRFNRACERTTGYSFDEVRGRLLWELFLIPEEIEPVKAVFAELQAGQFPNEYENYWLIKDGGRRLIAWSNTAILGADGAVEYVVGTGLEVTERRQAESERDATLKALRESHQALERRVAERTAELQKVNEALQQEIDEREQVEAALRQSEGHMRSLMESARSYAVYRVAVDPDNPFLGRVILASPSMVDLLSISDLYDFTTWFDKIHPDDLERIVEANRRSLEDGAPFDQQFRIFKEGRGEPDWVHVRSTPVHDPEGRLTHFNGLVVDVTEQKRAEGEIQRQNEYLAALHETTLGVVSHLDTADLLEAIVERAAHLVGGTHGFVYLVRPGEDELEVRVSTGPYQDYVGRRLKRGEGLGGIVYESGEPFAIDDYQAWSGRSAQYRYMPLGPAMGAPLMSGGGVVGVLGVGRSSAAPPFRQDELDLLTRFSHLASIALDNAQLHTSLHEELAERARAEEALRESELRFRAVFEGAPIGVSVTSLEAQLLETNRALQHMFGYSGEEFYNLPVPDFSHPEDMAVDADIFFNELVPGKRDGYQMEKRFIRKNGEMFWGRLSMSLARGEQGEPLFAIATTEDITERKQAEEALKEAYRTLEQRVEERTRELSTLLEVSKNLVSTLELEPLLGSILEELRSVVDYEGCMVFTLEGDKLVPRAHWGRMPREQAMSLRFGVDDPLDRLVLGGREPVLVSDTRDDSPTAEAYRESLGDLQETLYPHIRSWLGVPLVVKGQVTGELALDHSQPDHFSPARARLAMAFANQAAVAIENARLYGAEQERREESERRRQVAEGLREVLAILNSRQSLNDMLDLIATHACRVLGSAAAAVLSFDKAAGLLRVQAMCNLDPEYAAQISMPLGVGTAGRALAERRPVVISDTGEAATYLEAGGADRPELVPELLGQLVNRYCALFSVPIVVKDEAYGALTFHYREPHSFSDEEFSLALSVADQAALALENARLREQAEQAAAMEERGRLARELHDSVTQSLYSVTMYAEAAARMLNTSPEAAVEHLRDARDTAQEALREMRLLIYQLRPPVVEQGGLAVVLQLRLDAVERRGGIRADLTVEGDDRLSPARQAELHQIAQEALNNALKHAHAGQVQVGLRFGDATTHLEIQDDGVGFDLAAAQAGGGLGLPGMQERVQRLGGRLEITTAPGQGTKVAVEVPSGGKA